MKNYLTVLNIISSSLLFGFQLFTAEKDRLIVLLIWLVYLILALGPPLFRYIWISSLSAVVTAVLLIVCGPPREIYLLLAFQPLIAARGLNLPWIFTPPLFFALIPFVPREILYPYIFISLALSVLEVLYSRFSNKNEQLHKASEILASRNKSLIHRIDDSLINEACREEKKTRYYDGINRLKKLADKYSNKCGFSIMIYQNRNNLSAVRKIWNIILANCEEAFINTARHADAEKIEIRFTRFDKILKVEVSDNGRESPGCKPGEGLTRIERRMSGCNGKLLLNSKPSFSLIMLFPEVISGC